MYGFSESDRVLKKPQYTIWRQPLVVAVELRGELADAMSDEWRTAVSTEFERGGYPRFYAMDARTVEPDSTMAARYRSAVFVKRSLEKLEWAVVLISGARLLVVVRTVLRLGGMGNCSLVESETEFNAAIDHMKNGRRPTLASAVRASVGSE